MSGRRAHPARGASLYDFRDLDLMLKLEAEADDEGWIETEYLANAMGFANGDRRGVAIRLTWMRRYGMLDYDREKRLWRLTPGAQRVVAARVRAASKRELEQLPDEAMIEVMANVTHRYRFTDAMTATMLRREFLYGTAPR